MFLCRLNNLNKLQEVVYVQKREWKVLGLKMKKHKRLERSITRKEVL